MKKLFFLLYIAYFYWQYVNVFAQNPYLRPINYPYQLSTNTIYDLQTDKKGQIWLGTDKGLFRFNGKFAQRIPFLSTKQMEITNLQEDEKGRVWGINFASQIFYTENDSLKVFELPADVELKSSIGNYIIYKDFLWISTLNMVAKINIKTKKKIFSYYLKEGKSFISDMILFENKEIHVPNPYQKEYIIFQVDAIDTQKNVKIIDFSIGADCKLMVIKNKVYAIQKQHSERIMAIFENNRWKNYPEITNIDKKFPVYHLSKTDEKDIWICTKEGGFKWNIEKETAELYFPNKNITDVLRDYQGNYWISTLDTGLWFCPSLATKVYNPLPFLSEKGEIITQIQQDNASEKLWLGASKGKFYATNLEGENIETYQNDYLREITRVLPYKDKIIASSGFFDKNKTENSISFMKVFPKDFRTYQNKYLLIATANCGGWLRTFQNNIKDNQKFLGLPEKDFKILPERPALYYLENRRAYAVELDTIHQKYWIAYDNDLFEYDFEGNHKIIKTKDNQSIVARRMAIDKNGKLYVASFSQGILIVDNQQVIHQLNQKKGLKTNITRAIKNVRDTIWISTDEEIGYLLPSSFDLVDVLNDNAIGKIGFQDFYPLSQDLLLASGSNIISMPIHRTVVSDKLNCLPLKKEGDIFSPTFTIEALNYKNPLQTKIYYRLKNIDKDWQIVEDLSTTIKYSNLSNGTYTFEFYATDEVSDLKSKIYEMTFEIPKKWYQTYLFYLAIVCVIVFIMYLIVISFLKRYKEKQTQKEKLLVSQLTALRSQMNPHFLYNILNTVQGLVYSNLKKEAGQLLGNFSDLMRKSLQSSENAYISLKDEIEILQLYITLEKSRFDNNFSYIFDIENIKEYLSHKIPSMLIQPFIENSFKHGLLHKQGNKKLFVQFSVINDSILKIIIDDNGVGRKVSNEINEKSKNKSTGFATKATEKRIELLNHQLKIKIKLHIIDKNEGTKVEVLIPFV